MVKASDSLRGHRYNPLWRHIYRSFQDHLLRGDVHDEDHLYVERRLPPEGVSPGDVEAHVRDSPRKLLLISAPAGLGKTTFLKHVLARRLVTDRWAIVWVDVLSEYGQHGSRTAVEVVRELVRKRLGKIVAEGGDGRAAWHRFLLERLGDPEGIAGILLEELERDGALSAASAPVLAAFIERAQTSQVLEYTRALCAFIRTRLARSPAVVIDNVDQLSAQEIDEILGYADLLARGPESPGAPGDEHAAVLLAARPISLGPAGVGTRLITVGALRPPVIGDVLQRRLDWFLRHFQGRVARGTLISDDDGRQVDLRDLVGDVELAGRAPDAIVRELLPRLAGAITADATPYGARLAELVQILTNYNTRLCLLATAQYVASGHLDWRELVGALARDGRVGEVLTPRKTLKALILGVGAVYDTRTSWLCNLFSDLLADRVGVMARLRVLCAVDRAGEQTGLPTEELTHGLEALFGYPAERVTRTCANLLELGLLEERWPGRLALTEGGVTYLRRMLIDFEYLQHVLVDACVETPYLVPCTRDDEPASVRFQRVVRFSRWVRELETAELAHALAHGQEERYRRLFGDDLVCATLSRTLRAAIEWLPRTAKTDRSESSWRDLRQELEDLNTEATFESVEHHARRRAREQLRRMADAMARTGS